MQRAPVASTGVTARDLVVGFWGAMQANEWDRAAACLSEDCVVEWPCSGEKILGRVDFAEMQRSYPTRTGRWSFDLHRIVAEGETVVSEVTVTDGEQRARVVAFSEVRDGQVVRQVEYWPMYYDPPEGRGGPTSRGPRIP